MTRNVLLLTSLVVIGCGASESDDELTQALPLRSTIAIDVPGGGDAGTSADGIGATQQALVGETATFYRFTRTVSHAVNGGVLAILNLVEDIVSHRPTAREANKAVWGPITSGLSPAVYLLVVERTAPRQFNWVLTGKPRGAADADFKAVIAGHANVVDRAHGSGSFLVGFDALHALDPAHEAAGGIAVHYSNLSDPRVVEVGFKGFIDKPGGRVNDALYRYAQHAGGGGNFEFVTLEDVDGDGAEREVLAIVTRWQAGGAGRSDVGAAGGSLGDLKAHLVECWDESFARSYYTDNINMNPSEGDAASCAF